MKKTIKNAILFLALLLAMSYTHCDSIENNDPCDDTVLLPSISVQLQSLFFLYEKDKKSEREVKIEFEKFACGNDEPVPQGHFEFTGYMNSDDFFISGIVGYNLRNENDMIRIIFNYKDELGFNPAVVRWIKVEDFKGKQLVRVEITHKIN